MEEIIELIKSGQYIAAYELACELKLSTQQKYDLFVSDKAKEYNRLKNASRKCSAKTDTEYASAFNGNALYEDCRTR